MTYSGLVGHQWVFVVNRGYIQSEPNSLQIHRLSEFLLNAESPTTSSFKVLDLARPYDHR